MFKNPGSGLSTCRYAVYKATGSDKWFHRPVFPEAHRAYYWRASSGVSELRRRLRKKHFLFPVISAPVQPFSLVRC